MNDVIEAHKHSANHREEVLASGRCGCFYCLQVFPSSKITDWVDWPPETPDELQLRLGTTALCPYCGIDSVIAETAGYPLEHSFLADMRQYWFGQARMSKA